MTQRITQINAEDPHAQPLEYTDFKRFVLYLQNNLYRRSDEEHYSRECGDVLNQLKYNREKLEELIHPKILDEFTTNCQILRQEILKTQTIYKLLFQQSGVQWHFPCEGSMEQLILDDENHILDLCKKLEQNIQDTYHNVEQLYTELNRSLTQKEQKCNDLQNIIRVKLQTYTMQEGCFHRFLENFRQTQCNQRIEQIIQCECDNRNPSRETLQAILFNLLNEQYPQIFLTDERLKPLLGQQNNLALYLSDIVEIQQFSEQELGLPKIQQPPHHLKHEQIIVGNYKLKLNYIGEGSLRYQQEYMEDDDDGQIYNPEEYLYVLKELMLNLKNEYRKNKYMPIKICICNVFITKVHHSNTIFGIRLRVSNNMCNQNSQRRHAYVDQFLKAYYQTFLKQGYYQSTEDTDYDQIKQFMKSWLSFDTSYKKWLLSSVSYTTNSKIMFSMYSLYNINKVIQYLQGRELIKDYFILKEYEIKMNLKEAGYFRNTEFLDIRQQIVDKYQQQKPLMKDMRTQVIQYLNTHPNNLIKLRMLFFLDECLLYYPKVNDTFKLFTEWCKSRYPILPSYLELYLQNPQFGCLVQQMINEIQRKQIL